MQTRRTSEPTGSAVPSGAIPRADDALVIGPTPSLRRRNPASRLMSALRGDKHMVGAYPPGKER